MSGTAKDHAINMRGKTSSGDYGWYLVQPVGNAASTWTNNTITAYDSINIDYARWLYRWVDVSVYAPNTIAGEYGVYIDQTKRHFQW